MPIRPIDAVRSQDAVQLKHGENQKMQMAQSHISDKASEQALEKSQKVVDVFEAENTEYRYDAKEKGNGTYSGNGRGKKKKNKEDPELNEPIKPGGFDVLI